MQQAQKVAGEEVVYGELEREGVVLGAPLLAAAVPTCAVEGQNQEPDQVAECYIHD